MKYKTTKKAMKEQYKNIICVSYCGLQTLLSHTNPFAYSTRTEDWACDYYYINSNTIISTGYAPIGNINTTYTTCQKYEKLANEIFNTTYDYEKRCELLNDLIEQFTQEITK